MKKIALILVSLLVQSIHSQEENKDFNDMIEAEMKSASGKMDLKVNPNTLNYDITYHKLEFNVDPAVLNISGKVTTTFKALENMNSITFDLFKTSNPFKISDVKINNSATTFEHKSSHELVIKFPSAIASGSTATVEITYAGAASSGGSPLGGATLQIKKHNNVPVLWTVSEPYGARDWWPCKQDLNDKVDKIDVYITAPSEYKSVSNGIEQKDGTDNGTTKTTHYKHNYPIPAYLIAIAVTNYEIFNQQGGLGTAASPFFPIVNYLYPEEVSSAKTSLAVTPRIINFYETIIGPYPFRNEKYGHARAELGGGMEHTTVSFMNSWSRGLIAHEMAHQWFGDKVTCGTWKDIWLNEGITEYMSGCVVENFDGATSFVNWKKNKISSVIKQTDSNLYLTDAQLNNVGRIFSSPITYNKGSMVTHMLRYKLGDEKFFQGLRNYLADPKLAYKYAVTPQLQAQLEAVYGAPGSLKEFFNDWVYGKGFPTYKINASNSGIGKVTVQINQKQSDPSVSFFEMPVTIKLTGSGTQQKTVVLDNTSNGQTFVVDVPFNVTDVQFDPNSDIIAGASTATLGSENFDYDASIQMYPNPASDVLNIIMPQNKVLEKTVFYNSLGQKVLESTQDKITISSLEAGVYIVIFDTQEGKFHKNFIKK
jgi:aminopeptidase N